MILEKVDFLEAKLLVTRIILENVGNHFKRAFVRIDLLNK